MSSVGWGLITEDPLTFVRFEAQIRPWLKRTILEMVGGDQKSRYRSLLSKMREQVSKNA